MGLLSCLCSVSQALNNLITLALLLHQQIASLTKQFVEEMRCGEVAHSEPNLVGSDCKL